MEFSLQLAIFAIVNFIVLLVLLRLFLYKPVLKMLEERKQTISDSLAKAQEAKVQAEQAGEQISARIEHARGEAEGILAAARAAGEELKKQLAEEARAEAQSFTAASRAALNKEREEAIAALRNEAAALAVSAAGRILAEDLTAEQQQALLHKYVAKVGQLQ